MTISEFLGGPLDGEILTTCPDCGSKFPQVMGKGKYELIQEFGKEPYYELMSTRICDNIFHHYRPYKILLKYQIMGPSGDPKLRRDGE